MNDNDHGTEHEGLARLRASDPATGSHPDLHRLRHLIGSKAPASQQADAATAVRGDGLQEPRLRTPWVAAAAVAALAVGTGGFAAGMQVAAGDEPSSLVTADGDRQASPAAPGLDAGMAAPTGDGEGFVQEGMGSAEPAMGGGPMSHDPGPVRLVADEDLPESPGTAEVLALKSAVDAEEFYENWRERMGFEGIELPEDNYFGSGHGAIDPDTGRMMTVSTEGGPLYFSYEDIFAGEYCAEMYSSMSEEDLEWALEEWELMYGPDMPFPDADSCREMTGSRPSDEQALGAAADFLAQTGVPAGTFELKAPGYDDPGSTMVHVEGYPMGMEYGPQHVGLTVGPDGVVSAYGSIGELTSLGEYPVISATEAVERYGDRVFAMDFGVTLAEEMMPYEGDLEDTGWTEPAYELPDLGSIEDGQPIPLLLKDKAVTGAQLVTGTMWTNSGGSLEVPTWKLTTDDGMYYTVVALADEAIDWVSWE